MISLSECAPCKAMRLQQESEEEFRKRYGMVDLNRQPLQMGWKPYAGKMPGKPVYLAATASPAPAAPARPYLDQAQERLFYFTAGGLVGFPIGILSNVAFKSLRRYRKEAAMFVAMATGVGLLAAFLPVSSPVMSQISKFAGVLAGTGAADILLPKKIMASLPG
jgi:hypothetical protein